MATSYLDQMNYGGMVPGMPPVNSNMPMDASGGAGVGQTFNQGQGAQMGQAQMQTPQLTGWQKFGYVMDGIGAIGGLWGAIQQNKIAKQQLALSREAYNTNMNNSIKTYNTSLEDRIRARYAMEGRSDQADGYIDEHKLSR